MNELRLGDIKKLAWGHNTSEAQSWDSKPGPCCFHLTLWLPSSQSPQVRREFSESEVRASWVPEISHREIFLRNYPLILLDCVTSLQRRVPLPFLFTLLVRCVHAPWYQGHPPHSFYCWSTHRENPPSKRWGQFPPLQTFHGGSNFERQRHSCSGNCSGQRLPSPRQLSNTGNIRCGRGGLSSFLSLTIFSGNFEGRNLLLLCHQW